MKWNKVEGKFLRFYLDVIDHFFDSGYLSFQCLVVRKGVVDRARHAGDWDLARRKHFTHLLTNKIERCLRKRPAEEQTFRIWVDPIASRYAKAHEAVEVISNHVLAAALGERRAVDSVIVKNSRDTLQIQLCDLLLGAVTVFLGLPCCMDVPGIEPGTSRVRLSPRKPEVTDPGAKRRRELLSRLAKAGRDD